MEEPHYKSINPLVLVLFVFLLSMCSGMLFSFLGAQLISFLYGLSLFGEDLALLQSSTYEHVREVNLILVVCQHIGAFILPALIVNQHMRKRGILFIRWEKPETMPLLWAVLCMLATVPLIGLLAALNEGITFPESMQSLEHSLRVMEDTAAELTEVLLTTNSFGGLLVNLLVIACVPPIGEELLFRGVLQQLFTRWRNNIHLGIWLSALLFSLLHMQFYGFFPRMLLGGLLGYLFYYTGNIWVPIAAHFINNAFAVILTFCIHQGWVDAYWGSVGSDATAWWMVLISLLLSLFLFYKVITQAKQHTHDNR